MEMRKGVGRGRRRYERLLITEGCTKYKFKHGNGTAKNKRLIFYKYYLL